MRLKALYPLVVCAFLLIPGSAAAEDFYVKPDVHGPQAPGSYPGDYDCAGPNGPEGAVESVTYDVDGLTDGTRWGLPYVEPSCLAADVRVGSPDLGDGGGSGSGKASGLCGRGLSGAVAWRVDCRWTTRSPVADTRTSTEEASDLVGLSTSHREIRVRATYNVTSGRYYVGVDTDAPANLRLLGGDLEGDSGIGILFNCRECSPPWE